MAVSLEHEAHDHQTFNYRWGVGSGDTLIVYFTGKKGALRRIAEFFSYFYIGVAWRVKPAAGASIAVSTHFDGDVDDNPDWDDHGKHPTITLTTGYYEDAPLGGLRYVASSGSAKVSIRSPQQVAWVEG